MDMIVGLSFVVVQGYNQFPCLDTFPLCTAFKKFLLIKACKLRPVVAVCGFIDRIKIFLLGVTGYIGNPATDIVELAHLNK